MRITSRMMVDNAIRHMEENRERLSALQERTGTGKQYQVASDDPARAAAGLSLRSSLQTNAAYIDTGHVAGDWLDANELNLKQMVEVASKALTLAKQGVSETQGPDERMALGQNLDSLLQQAVEVANATHNGSYLFAGFKVTTQPYTYTPASVTNNLASTADQMQRSIEPGQSVTVNVDGNATFNPLFSALAAARDALNANDTAALQTALTGLDSALKTVTAARTSNGALQQQVTDTLGRMDKTQIALKNLLSLKEDASLAESISLLKNQEVVYQASLEVGNRAILPSLFDYLR